MAIGTRMLPVDRVEVGLEGIRWAVVLRLEDGCYLVAVFDATTGRSTEAGHDC